MTELTTPAPVSAPVGAPTSAPARAYDVSLAPRGLAVVLLVGCRAAFRGLWLAAPLLLATTWSPGELSATVTAIGGFGWLAVLLASAEKTVLKHVPRLPRLAGQVARSALSVAALPLGLSLVAAVVLSVLGHGAAIWAWGLVWAITGGLLQSVAALHRLERRAWRDGLIFGAAALWLLGVTGATIAADWSPITWLAACTSGLLLVAAAATALAAPTLRGIERRSARRPIAASFLLLGLPEVLSLASVSAGYWALAAASAQGSVGASEATRFYVAVTAAGVAGAFVLYLVRLHQPDVSLRARDHAAAVLDEAGGWLDRALVTGVAVGVLALVAWALGAPELVVLAGLTAGEIVVFTQRTVAVNRIENAAARRLPVNVAAGAAGLATACLVLCLLVASGAASGALVAMGALVAAQVVNASVLRVVGVRR